MTRRAVGQLVFVNSDATPKTTLIWCDRTSVPGIMAWYGAFYAGDRYYVTFDGERINKGRNGEILP